MVDNTDTYGCLNYFKDSNEFNAVFEASDDQIKNCNHCPCFQYEDGIQTCTKFS